MRQGCIISLVVEKNVLKLMCAVVFVCATATYASSGLLPRVIQRRQAAADVRIALAAPKRRSSPVHSACTPSL